MVASASEVSSGRLAGTDFLVPRVTRGIGMAL